MKLAKTQHDEPTDASRFSHEISYASLLNWQLLFPSFEKVFFFYPLCQYTQTFTHIEKIIDSCFNITYSIFILIIIFPAIFPTFNHLLGLHLGPLHLRQLAHTNLGAWNRWVAVGGRVFCFFSGPKDLDISFWCPKQSMIFWLEAFLKCFFREFFVVWSFSFFWIEYSLYYFVWGRKNNKRSNN